MKKGLIFLCCFIFSFEIESMNESNLMPPPPPVPPAPSMLQKSDKPKLSYKEQQKLKLKKARDESESRFKYIRDALMSNNFSKIDCINDNLKENCYVSIEVLKWNKSNDLLGIREIIENEKKQKGLTNKDIAVFFDFDNTITRNISVNKKDILLPEHRDLLNSLTNKRIDWCIITASRAEGPRVKYDKMMTNGVMLSRANLQEQRVFLPTLLTHKGDGNYGINHKNNMYDLATIEYISCGDNVLLAGIPEKNNQIVDGVFTYNDTSLLTDYGKLGYASDGYQKPAAMRYFIKNKSEKKLIIVVDDNPRNIKDFIDDFKAKLTGNVANSVKLVAIWYQPTEFQRTEHIEFAGILKDKYDMHNYD